MTTTPLLSYIVLSYNYERYIAQTLRSILDQTVQDFEIIVVDDASSDASVAIVSALGDPRIRLFVNEKNLGGAGSYNRAVQEARGEWLVNLDADDWIDPRKAEIQLQAVLLDPTLDIVGTYVAIHDENDAPHPSADSLERFVNQPHDLNLVDNWIGANRLCRSSTMVRASAHHRIGLDDPAMVRAPDYELWTRALRMGCRFAIVPERLTFMRLHSRGVTHADPTGAMMEMAYATLRNLVPLAETRALLPSITRMVAWVGLHPSLSRLRPWEAHRLVGLFMQPTQVNDFLEFTALISDESKSPELAAIGQRCLTFVAPTADAHQDAIKLRADIVAFIEARDFYRQQSERWEHHYRELEGAHKAMVESFAQRGGIDSVGPLLTIGIAPPRRMWSRLKDRFTK